MSSEITINKVLSSICLTLCHFFLLSSRHLAQIFHHNVVYCVNFHAVWYYVPQKENITERTKNKIDIRKCVFNFLVFCTMHVLTNSISIEHHFIHNLFYVLGQPNAHTHSLTRILEHHTLSQSSYYDKNVNSNEMERYGEN